MIAPWTAPRSTASRALSERMGAIVPRLTTAHCQLRAPLLSDFTGWAAIWCSDRSRHFEGPYDESAAWTEFAALAGLWVLRGHGLWAVDDHDGELAGFVLIGFEPGDQEPELGFMMLAAAEGRGLAFEAASAARDWAFADLGLPALVSYVAPGNARAQALARRMGARPDGRLDGCDIWRHPAKGQA